MLAGPHGAGYTVKLMINLLWFAHLTATAEVLNHGDYDESFELALACQDLGLADALDPPRHARTRPGMMNR